MAKILFIVPPHITFQNFVHPAANTRHVQKADGRYYGALITDMPIGILSLSAYVKKHQPATVTQLVDFNILLNERGDFPFENFSDYFRQELQRVAEAFQPEIIGISALFSPSYYNLLDMAARCRDLFPQALILAGGCVPSSMYFQIFRESRAFDALCYGEGEKPLLALVGATDRKQCLEEHSSWITYDKIINQSMFSHDFIENLDDIPFFDYQLCNVEKYGKNLALTAYAGIGERNTTFHVMSSRGCPFKCVFCASHKVHGREMRYYSLTRVKEDLERLRDHYGAKTVVFQDDHLMGDKKRAQELVRMVADMGLHGVYQNGLAIYGLDRPMLETMKAAGVDHLNLSVESGSERVLKHIMKKPLKLAMVERAARDCRELGIYTEVNILIGLPGETREDIEKTHRFLTTIDANWFMILCASPLVGSEMYDICVEKNYLKEGFIGSDFKKAVIETEAFSADYIQDKAYALNLEFNFVRNSDMRHGRYDLALRGLENAIRSKHDHAFGYYFAGQCHEKLGNADKAAAYLERARELYRNDPYWRDYFTRFGIQP